MESSQPLPPAPEMIPLLIADVYHAAGAFRRSGERIAASVGQSQARWQVLSAASGEPRTVAQIARRLGYARQSVQRTADQLVREQLAQYSPNPDHKTSPFLVLTGSGAASLKEITKAARKWHMRMARQLEPEELATALRVVRKLIVAADRKSR